MGMFDTFIAEKNGKKIEIQTKELENLLDVFELGDFVPSLGDENRSFVIVEDDYPEPGWFGFIIYNNVYLDFVELVDEHDKTASKLLNEYEQNQQMVVDKLLEIVSIKNEKILHLEKTKNEIINVVMDFDEYKKTGFEYENERLRSFLLFTHKYADYFKNGGDLNDLLKKKLKIEN